MIVIKPDKALLETVRMLKEYPKRMKAAEIFLLRETAKAVSKGVRSRLPKTSDYADLRDSLEVVRGSSSSTIYAVRAHPMRKSISELDAKKTLIYFKPKSTGSLLPKDVAILVQFSPWTLDTLPYKPDGKYATLVHRKSTAEDVSKIRNQRRKEKPTWRRKLIEAGARLDKGSKRLDVSGVKSAPDYVFDSLNLEFGLGKKSSPHWRPSILKFVKGSGLKNLLKNPALQATLSNPSYRGWKKLGAAEGEARVPMPEIDDLNGFQKKLGLLL